MFADDQSARIRNKMARGKKRKEKEKEKKKRDEENARSGKTVKVEIEIRWWWWWFEKKFQGIIQPYDRLRNSLRIHLQGCIDLFDEDRVNESRAEEQDHLLRLELSSYFNPKHRPILVDRGYLFSLFSLSLFLSKIKFFYYLHYLQEYIMNIDNFIWNLYN